MNHSIISPTQAALVETDRCVKCGLCLPDCPTYRLHADENASPRGRIALAEALLQGTVPADQSAKRHIDQCLLCQRCEKVCPSQVNYSKIIDTVRQQWVHTRWTDHLIRHPKLFAATQRLAHILPKPARWPPSIRLAQALKSTQTVPKPGVYAPTGTVRGRVGLLLGCVTRAVQADALHASIRLLNALGYAVLVPRQQGCCGALAAHQGDAQSAAEMATANRQAFAEQLDLLLTTASACAAYMQQHALLELPTTEIAVFLAQAQNLQRLTFKPLQKTVAVHQPCSLVNGLHQDDVQSQLLQQIPGLGIIQLGTPGNCCGAAGNHMLTQRAQAEALRQPLLDQLRRNKPDYLVSNNIGCALHLAEGIKKSALNIDLVHPAQLLAQQL